MTWETFVFIPVAAFFLGYSAYRFSILIRLMKASRGRAFIRQDIVSRIWTTIDNVFGQRAVLRKKKAGLMHATIFWGFLIISVGTLEQFCTTIHPSASFEFLGNPAYLFLKALEDLFTFLVLAAVLYACYRRFLVRPSYLGQSSDANRILLLTGLLMISILLMNGFFLVSGHYHYGNWAFFSSRVAEFIYPLGLSSETAYLLGKVFKWIHMLLVLGFAAYIPHSKHLHVAAAGPNTYLRNLTVEKPMAPINFEDETLEQYGAGKITDLSWKDTLDYFACTECGRCQEVCPAWNTQKPLSPKLLIMDLKENLYRNKDAILKGELDSVSHVIDENVTEDVIWACTSCRACETACPVFIQQTDKIYEIRRNLVMMEARFPQEVQTVFKNMETNATPWAFSSEDRAKWAEGTHVKTIDEEPNPEVLLWVGCAGAYDDRNKKVVKSFSNLMRKAGVRFSILGKKEKCTGDPARRIGNEYLFQTLAQENVNTLNEAKIKKIVTTCPHCFNTLKNEYKDFGGDYEVQHHTQYIHQLIKENKIKPAKEMNDTVTFHDSCYIGRWNGVYEEPREILESLPSARLVEMKSNKKESMCCGAGGGRMWMEETIGERVNISRTEQAIETKADIVASSCPFCMTMMTDGVKAKQMQDKVTVKDIAEIIDDATPV